MCPKSQEENKVGDNNNLPPSMEIEYKMFLIAFKRIVIFMALCPGLYQAAEQTAVGDKTGQRMRSRRGRSHAMQCGYREAVFDPVRLAGAGTQKRARLMTVYEENWETQIRVIFLQQTM